MITNEQHGCLTIKEAATYNLPPDAYLYYNYDGKLYKILEFCQRNEGEFKLTFLSISKKGSTLKKHTAVGEDELIYISKTDLTSSHLDDAIINTRRVSLPTTCRINDLSAVETKHPACEPKSTSHLYIG
jgi:hypothetical protein